MILGASKPQYHTAIVSVKVLAGKTGWPIDNVKPGNAKHFIVFVCFHGEIAEPSVSPLVWVVPSLDIHALAYNAPGGRKLMNVSTLKAKGSAYLEESNKADVLANFTIDSPVPYKIDVVLARLRDMPRLA